ncbi:hypothetical protein [Actinomadura rudentiformis]|uniref:Uncharacterized protein n=1 Tax=Actinomadura rudentiformis TaxID=359158 RepID=A0A6H9YLD1_9ACTN|nr:hypothetical protein [Actinomadura rudentiformis]KAB2348028.1 hypothetical protein F8566_19365 [Actinomadura rudentiformis]
MKSKPMLAVAGAVGGTVLATAGITAFLMTGEDGGASARPGASARAYGDTKDIAAALRKRGATGCRVDQARVECRFGGRYVAGTVLSPGSGSGLTMDTALESWKTGIGQSALGEPGAFAILHGPNWLVTGPDALIDKVRPALGGQVLHCDRPFGTCT